MDFHKRPRPRKLILMISKDLCKMNINFFIKIKIEKNTIIITIINYFIEQLHPFYIMIICKNFRSLSPATFQVK